MGKRTGCSPTLALLASAALALLAGCAIFTPAIAPPAAALALEAGTGALEPRLWAKARTEPSEASTAEADYLVRLRTIDPESEGWPIRMGTIPWKGGLLGAVLVSPPPGQEARGTIFALHGYLSYSLYTLPLLRQIAATGWAVVAIDLPGHGYSSGARADIRNFNDYAKALQGVVAWADRGEDGLPRPFIIMGHSLGGAATIETLHEMPEEFSAAILLAPLVYVKNADPALVGATLLGPFVASAKAPVGHDGYLDAERVPLSWVRAYGRWEAGLGRYPAITKPALIIQGEADKLLDWEKNLDRLARLFPEAKTQRFDQAGHVAFFDRGIWQVRTLAFIEAFLADTIPRAETTPREIP